MGGSESKTIMQAQLKDDKIVVVPNNFNKNNETVEMKGGNIRKFNNKYKKKQFIK